MSKTSVFKRGLTAFMAMLLCLSSFIGLGTTTAYAAGEQAEVYMISFPRDGDANYGGDWGHPNLDVYKRQAIPVRERASPASPSPSGACSG